MQCPMCKHLRHPGPCDPVYEDDGEVDFLEMLDAVTPEGTPFTRAYQADQKQFWYRLIDTALGETP